MKKAITKILFFILLGWPNLWAGEAWQPIQEIVIQADLASDHKEQKALAKKALALAEACLQKNPKEAACYYYRAQALGLSNQSFLGYMKRIRSMREDWAKTMAINPNFDYGGPYRMFAEIYMELPRHFGPSDLRQDLKKALDYLNKAIKIADNYPTNQLDMAKVLFELNKQAEARHALEKVDGILPRWKSHPYYASWLNTLKSLKGK